MTRGETKRLLAATGAAWQQIMQQCRDGNVDRLYDLLPGLTATSYDDAPHTKGGVSDPTGRQVVVTLDGRDPVASDELYLADILEGMHSLATQAARLLGTYHRPGAPDERARLELARENRKVEPGCASCARTEQAKGVPRWSPPASFTRGKPTRGPRKPGTDDEYWLADDEAQLLCRWCYDRLGLWHRLPTPKELTMFHEFGAHRVPWPKDVPHPDRARSA